LICFSNRRLAKLVYAFGRNQNLTCCSALIWYLILQLILYSEWEKKGTGNFFGGAKKSHLELRYSRNLAKDATLVAMLHDERADKYASE